MPLLGETRILPKSFVFEVAAADAGNPIVIPVTNPSPSNDEYAKQVDITDPTGAPISSGYTVTPDIAAGTLTIADVDPGAPVLVEGSRINVQVSFYGHKGA